MAYLTTDEAAEVLRVKPATLRQWRSRGIGPCWLKSGTGSVRYTRDALETFLRAQRD